MVKKVLSIIIAASMLLSFTAVTALADQTAVEAAIGEFTEANLLETPLSSEGYLIDSLKLPGSFGDGVSLSYTTSNRSIIDERGNVYRPADENAEVEIGVKFSKGTASDSKFFKFTVPALSKAVDDIPALCGTVYADGFDGDVPGSDYVLEKKSSKHDGYITLYKPNSGAALTFYTNEAHSTSTQLDGSYYTEFIMSKERTHVAEIKFFGAGGSLITTMDWKATNSGNYFLTYYGRNSAGSGGWINITANSEDDFNDIKFGLYFNAEDQNYTVYINNNPIILGEAFRSTLQGSKNPITGLSYITISIPNDNTATTIESFRMYSVNNADLTDEEKAQADADSITLNDLINHKMVVDNTVVSNLTLPITASNGSVITWATSDSTVCQNNGIITRANNDDRKEVTLTATVANGEATVTKAITFYVAGKKLTSYNVYPSVYNNDKSNILIDKDFEENEDFAVVEGATYTAGSGFAEFVGPASGNKDCNIYNTAEDRTNRKFNTSFSGVICVEFDITRTADKTIVFNLGMASSGWVAIVSWDWNATTNSNAHIFTIRETADATATKYIFVSKNNCANTNSMSVKVLIDTDTGMYDLWANGQQLLNNVYSRRATDLAYNGTYFRIPSGTNIKVDNYRIYNAMPPSETAIEYDLADIDSMDFVVGKSDTVNTAAKTASVISDLNLYTNMLYGSEVVWTSSDNSVINPETGKVTRGAEDKTVTLTANVGNVLNSEASREFSITVKAYVEPIYSAIAAEGAGKAQYFVTKDAGTHPEAKAYLALYDGNELVAVKFAGFADGANDGTQPAAELAFTSDEIKSANVISPKLKAFLWSADSNKPLCTHVLIPTVE